MQASGRVQRKHSEKHVPLIIDVVDSFSIFEMLRWKRCSSTAVDPVLGRKIVDADDWFV